MKTRTRFSPSPTGYLHIGGARTALYSWLFTRNHGGEFILRIEDTDLKRSTPESVEAIMDDMNWLNLKWDEGPYFQSNRFNRYHEVINEMLETKLAYKCFCSKERLDILREEQIRKGMKPRYDSYCRQGHAYHDDSKPYTIRFANPKRGTVVFNDQIRGQIKFNNRELDDLIICRADGSPTYNFCAVVDDWDMSITHVIRGEEHISNTPRQINILRALNAPIPIYAHVSMILGEDGRKLSKRHGAISLMHYRNDGYLPDALLNYLVRLGWSSGDREIFNLEEMIKLFSLDSVSRSASTFNINRLKWFNHYYINTLSGDYVSNHLQKYVRQENIDVSNGPQLSEIVKLFGRRCKTLKEIAKSCRYFYEECNELDIDIVKKHFRSPIAYQALTMIRNKFSEIRNWNVESIHHAIWSTSSELAIKIEKVGMPLRIAITGVEKSPPLDEMIYSIGKDRSISRIDRVLNFSMSFR